MAPIEVVIVGNTTDAEQKLGGLGNTFSNLGNIVSGLQSAFDLVAGAFNGIVDFGGQFVASASDSEQAIARLEGVLRATGGAAGVSSEQLQGWAAELQNSTRFSDEMIMSSEAVFLTFRNIGADVLPRAIVAAADLAEVFGSLDASTMQLGKALQDPVSMLGALSRAGVTFTDAQKEMIKNFVETGDVAAAQNIILSEVEAQVGGLAQVMGQTFAGQVEIFKNKWDEVKELIGGPIIEVLSNLMDTVMRFAETNPVFQGVVGFLERWNELLSVGQPFWYSLGLTMLRFADVSPIFSELGSAFIDLQHALDNGIAPLTAINNLLDDLAQGDGPLAGIAQTIQTFIETGESEGWGVAIQNLFTGITEGLDFGGAIQRLLGSLQTEIAQTDWTAVGNTLAGILTGAIRITMEGLDIVINQVDWGPAGIALKNALKEMWSAAWSSMLEEGDTATVVEGMQEEGRESMRLVGEAAWEGFIEGLNQLDLSAQQWVDDHIINPIKDALGIASPSTVFMQIGKDIVLGLIGGFGSMIGTLGIVVQGIVDIVLSIFQPVLDILGFDTSGSGSIGGRTVPMPPSPTPGTTTGGGTSIIQNFAGAIINVGSWDEITYDCVYPNPFIVATGGGGVGGTSGGGTGAPR